MPTILVVEDEYLIAMSLIDELEAFGYAVRGPIGEIGKALSAAETLDFDAAILDINLRGQLVFPVAERIASRGVPFVFVSGNDPGLVPVSMQAAPFFAKPCDYRALQAALKALVG